MTGTLRGQTAVITGAGSAEGIGFAIARRLHAAGVRVVITSTTERIHLRARTGCEWRGGAVLYRRSHRRNRGAAARRFRAFARGADPHPGEQCRDDADRAEHGEQAADPDFVCGMAEPDFDYAAHGVSNDARGIAGYDGTKVRADCECDFGDGAAGEQCWLGGLWRGQGGDGWDDAGCGDGDSGRRDYDQRRE